MTSLLDLVKQASGQSWAGDPERGTDYRPVTSGDRSNGFFKVQGIKAEDGSAADTTLWISPRSVANGQTELHFPAVAVAPNGVFRAQIGFMGTSGRSSDGVDYGVRVRYHVGNTAHEATVGFGHKNFTGSLLSLNLDLSPFAGVANGGQLELYLRVGAGNTSDHDYAQTVSVGGDNDDFVGAASFEASLLDLLIAGRAGQLIQLNHQNSGKGRYEMTGRLVMV